MTTYQTSIVAGVFQNEAQVKEAIDSLRSANFRYDQIGIAVANTPTSTADLRGDLIKLGVPQEHADYYESEYNAGHVVVSVRPDGRDSEALDILRRYGSYNYEDDRANSANTSSPAQTNMADNQQQSAQPTTNQALGTNVNAQEQPPQA
jgi:hypothetical protein